MRVPKKIAEHSHKVLGGFYQRRWAPPDYEWLYDQYIIQGKSANQIAWEQDVGCSKTVTKWLAEVGIHCRNIPEARALVRVPWGHRDARRVLEAARVPKICTCCGTTKQQGPSGKAYHEAHHKDGNERNNNLENLEWLCTACHQRTHAGWYD